MWRNRFPLDSLLLSLSLQAAHLRLKADSRMKYGPAGKAKSHAIFKLDFVAHAEVYAFVSKL